MPDRWSTYPIQFTGGLVSNVSQLAQGIQTPGSARVLNNFEPAVDGGYRRIEGFTKYDDAVVPGTDNIRGVFFLADTAYVARDDSLYFSGGSGWTELTDNATYGSAGINLGAGGNICRFTSLDFDGNTTLIVTDQVSKPFRYKAGVFSQLTGAPSEAAGASHAIEYKNHLFLASDSNLIFSAPFDESDFAPASGAGSVNVKARITGLLLFRELLIIFTETSILSLSGNSISDFNLQPITQDLGCVSEDTIQEIGGDVIFLGPDGLRLLSATQRNNDFGLAVVSKVIQKEATDFIRSHSSFCSVTIPSKSQYRILGFNSGYTPDAGRGIIGVQMATQGGEGMSWSETTGIFARVATSVYSERDDVILFANTTGYVYRMESGNTFDGNNIEADFATPYFPITDPSTRKTLYKADVYTDPQGAFTVNLNVLIDYQQAGVIQPNTQTLDNTLGSSLNYYDTAIYGSAVYSTDQVSSLFKVNLVGSGNVFSFRFSSDDNSAPYSLDSISIQYAQNGRR